MFDYWKAYGVVHWVIRKEFDIPDNLEPVAIIAIGYADTQKASPDRHSLERKAVDEFVFYETF